MIKDQSIFSKVIISLILTTNSLDCVLIIVGRKLMFVTFETWRVKRISCTCTVLHGSLFSCLAIVLNILLLLILFYSSIPLRRYAPKWSIPYYNSKTLMPNWCILSLRTKWQTLPCGEVLKSLHHSNRHSSSMSECSNYFCLCLFSRV